MSSSEPGVSDELADLTTMRAGLDAFAAAVSVREPIDQVLDGVVSHPGHEVPIRTYVAADADDTVLVWLHGGGYVAGSLAAVDPLCRTLARRLGSTVVSVGYRLAPENPFPAALEDAMAVVSAVGSRPDVRQIAVGGDSAGGGLAAAVAALSEVVLCAHVLLCPFLDATLSCPSVVEKGDGYGLTQEALRGFARMYVGPAGDLADPRVSPLLGTRYAALPPAVVVTAGDDPLRDEGELYAARIAETGGRAHLRRWEGMPHGFVGMTAEVAEADTALQWAADLLRTLLNGAPG